MTDITELAQREKFEAWLSERPLYDERYVYWCDSLKAYDYTGIQTAWEAYQAGGAELVEALEKAQAKNALVAGGIEAAAKLHEQIASLKSENAALKGSVENAAGCINAAYAEGLIDVLAESSDERLVDLVKRRLLHAYLPVETPATDDVLVAMGDAVLLEQLEDSRKATVSQSNIIGLQANRIAELESRTVTVKMPEVYGYLRENDGQIQISIGAERPSDRSGGYATPWFAIYTAAGIKVEAE